MKLSIDQIMKKYKKQFSALHLSEAMVLEAIQSIGFQSNDLFRFTFASGDPSSNFLLQSLCSLLLHRPVLSVAIKNSEPAKNQFYQRGIRLDVLAEVIDANSEKHLINLEIQNYGTTAQNVIRSQGYLASLISGQLVQGDRTMHFEETVQVMLCNSMRELEDTEEFLHEYRYEEVSRHTLLPDNRSALIFVELNKLEKLEEKPVEEWTELEQMGYMIRYSQDREKHDIIEELKKKEVLRLMEEKREKFYESIEESILAIKEYWDKEEEKAQYQMAEERGEKRGVEQGIEMGKVLGFIDACRLLKMEEKELLFQLKKQYGLSEEEASNLLNEKKNG